MFHSECVYVYWGNRCWTLWKNAFFYFSVFFSTHYVCMLKTSTSKNFQVFKHVSFQTAIHTMTEWKLETARLYTNHILTFAILHNHVHQVQSFSTSFHLQLESNFHMSWQLKTLSEAISDEAMFFLASSPKISHNRWQRFSMYLDGTEVGDSSKLCASHSAFQIQKENQGAIIFVSHKCHACC